MKPNWIGEFETVKEDYVFGFEWEKITEYCKTLEFPKGQLIYLEALGYKWNEVCFSDAYPHRTYPIWHLLENEIKRLRQVKIRKVEKVNSEKKGIELSSEVIAVLKQYIDNSPDYLKPTRRNEAAISFRVAFSKKHTSKKLLPSASKLAKAFFDYGIWTEGKLGALERTFRDIKTDSAQSKLVNDLLNSF